MSGKTYEHIIAGAGCAGLSLVWQLLEAGIDSRILLIDSRQNYVNDRTWCYWRVEETPFDDLADHAWSSWEIHANETLQAIGACERYPYLHLRSDAFYRRVLDRIVKSPKVSMVLGEDIHGYQRKAGQLVVSTSGGEYTGRQVFDSSGVLGESRGQSVDGESPVGARKWLQHFLGQQIKVRRPVFRADRIRLMDHRVDQARGPHFIYLLPFSETTALIENTYFFNAPLSPLEHREEIAHYLDENYGLSKEDYEVLGEESGRIPMGSGGSRQKGLRRQPADEGIIPIGIPGGAARAATGYAFLRIQRQSRYIAQRIVSGRELNRSAISFGAAKYRLFDQIMLQALATSPELAPSFFTLLFKRANSGSVVRFLTEKSNLLDDLQVVGALLKPDLLRMILRLS